MRRNDSLLPMVLLAVVLAGRDAAAQEFSVYTQVFDVSPAAEGRRSPVGRSLSLFHAGKVYDYIENGRDGEVIIFEPALERFRILSTTRSMWTNVHFDQLHHKLKLARGVAERHLAALEHQPPPAGSHTAGEIRFVLQPRFEETFVAGKNVLTLTSPLLNYRAVGAASDRGPPPSPEQVEAYLRYADAVARMNYILHPHPLGPEPRLALNAALRQRGLIPVAVELHSQIGGEARLRAEHKFRWKLEAPDRSRIHEWESALSDGALRQVTLDEYQRILLGGPTGSGR